MLLPFFLWGSLQKLNSCDAGLGETQDNNSYFMAQQKYLGFFPRVEEPSQLDMHGKEAMIKQHVKTKRTLASFPIQDWLVVSTHLKNISQNGKLPQIGMKIKHV